MGERLPVCQLGIPLPRLLQYMPILNPDGRVAGVAIKGSMIKARRDLQLPEISGAVGTRDYALLAALAPRPIGLVRRNRRWDIAQQLRQILCRTPERRQFVRGLLQRLLDRKRPQIRGLRLFGPALQDRKSVV